LKVQTTYNLKYLWTLLCGITFNVQLHTLSWTTMFAYNKQKKRSLKNSVGVNIWLTHFHILFGTCLGMWYK
jgi:hypothetical protein